MGELRDSLVIPGAWGDAGLVLLMLWLLAQLNPALPFFGAGDIGGYDVRIEIEILQAAAVSMGICGFGLFASALLKSGHGSLRVTLVLLSIAVWLKFAAAPLLLQPHYRADWVDEARVAGLLLGILAFVPARRHALRAWRTRAGAAGALPSARGPGRSSGHKPRGFPAR